MKTKDDNEDKRRQWRQKFVILKIWEIFKMASFRNQKVNFWNEIFNI